MVRMLLEVAGIGLFTLLAVLLPRDREQRVVNPDLVINLLTGGLIFLTLAPVARMVESAVGGALIGTEWLGDGTGLSGVAQFAVAFLLLDFTRYWVHRADHRVPFLWKFHRVHHSVERMDATAGLRMHAVDFVQLSIIPILLFGVLLDTSSFVPWSLQAAFGIGIFFDTFQHANLRFDITHPLLGAWHKVLNNPHFHAWHHTREGNLCDGNYANSVVIWDRLFGSNVTRPELPELFGINEKQALAGTRELQLSPRTLLAVLKLQLLRPRPRDQ
ncbi:MAG: sterol desaturase/sphingolipid hydroxylase (fatty acid hydroxylase superfamily) [Myxococcota bacterium]|jgi:sterol desaturase/sphingolipid hydroxylase (fatty acid hydroxylase superfamily)